MADRSGDPRHRRRGQGRSVADARSRGRRSSAAGRIPALGDDRQQDDRADERVLLRSDARRARSRHGRQARRTGESKRRVGRVEGSDRIGQPDGVEPHRAGAQHFRSDDRGRERGFVAQDHGRRARRNPAVEGGDQHAGRSVAFVYFRSDARGARSRHRRQARRPGHRAGRGRYVEGSDRLGQRDGDQPNRAGAQHRRSDHGRGARRLVAQDRGGRERRNPRAEERHQHDGRSAQRFRGGSDARGARSGNRRKTRRPGAGDRRIRRLEGSDRQRQLDGIEPDRAGAQHRAGRYGHRERRPVAQDHGGRARRNHGTQGNLEHHGRAVALVRIRSDARGARSRHRRKTRRPGARAGCRGYVEGFDGQRQLDGRRT